MNGLEEIIMEEISSLDEMRLIDVIGFIRYLKADKPIHQKWNTDWYESAMKEIQKRQKESPLSPTDTEHYKGEMSSSPNG